MRQIRSATKKTAKKLAPVALAAAVCATGFLAGCDDTRSADRRVANTIEESRMARLKEGGDAQAQSLLQKAAAESDASAATRAHVKALLGDAQMEAASQAINDPTFDEQTHLANGIDVGNREIARLLWEINQQGQHIALANALAGAYASFEPKEVKAAATTQSSAVVGAGDNSNWIGEGTTAIPTITAAQQKVAALNDQIAQQQKAIDDLTKERTTAFNQASELQRQSETEKGEASVQTYDKSSDLRKQAADTQNRIDVENNKLARLKADAALVQAQLDAVTAAKAQFDKFAQQLDAGWAPIRDQIMHEREQSSQILSGKGESTIAAKATKLGAQMDKTAQVYNQAQKNLEDAIKSFQDAARAAGDLANSMRQSMATLTDPVLKSAMNQLLAVYNINVFKLSEANATLKLAHLQGSHAQVLAEQKHIIDQLASTLKNAGLSLPKELDDSKLADQLKQATADAKQRFDEAQNLYGDVAEGAGAPEVDRAAAAAGRIYACYGAALLARATGDEKTATDKLTEAKQRRDALAQDGKGGIALPSELVVLAAPTTAPATAPTSAPAAPAAPGAAQPAPAQ